MADKTKSVPSTAASKSSSTEVELDVKTLLMPLAIVISAVIISIPISLSIYFGLRDAGLGGGGGTAQAAECDPTTPFSKDCLTEKASKLNMDANRFRSCLDSNQFDSIVQEELDYGNEIGIQGTPTIYFGENKGDKVSGINVGASITETDLDELSKKLNEGGIKAAADYWKKKQTDGLGAYETQLRDYYSQQGQSGSALDSTVKTALNQRKAEIEEEVKVKDLTVGQGQLRGNKDAKPVLMEFSDYECPYCKSYAQGIGKSIKTNFVDPGKVLFIYRDFPLESIHPNARRGANAARCAADQGKYFEMHDAIFAVEE
jgi:protein-disulfide isomerase